MGRGESERVERSSVRAYLLSVAVMRAAARHLWDTLKRLPRTGREFYGAESALFRLSRVKSCEARLCGLGLGVDERGVVPRRCRRGAAK